ncbi:branched-chain amino acid ABC transporter permease [Aliibacillus thermotolerans]|uniref:Branched-chain amino acid ABC transporter permease n=1 Tax=Aliibacillus thermotolerans TaxID=1834418 RepID=A0ABW0U528_9BACI|nr:branched-chain amino acid ABC transporter permease [Aliibacillus thermotolerans]MDA3130444.1 branched-chain amino acid ABC transporter permease [Aliibacillus thermotolerans]
MTYLKFGIAVLLFGAAPFFLASFHISLLTEILILAIFALSLNILVGYTGLVSLGHAAFFGAGAYAAGLIGQHVSAEIITTLLGGVLVSFMLALVVGIFCMKVNGFYFLMLTLAFSQMIYSFIYQSTTWTGGSNGLTGIPTPSLLGLELSNIVWVFYVTAILFLLLYAGISIFVKSPFGRVLVGIKENETRLKSMGYNTKIYRYVAFVISGTLGGLSGVLFTYFNGFIAPTNVYWTMSGTVLIMVLIGGAGTMIGPVLGAALIVILETVIATYTDMWMLLLGVIFIFFVIFLPEGIYGVWQRSTRKWLKGKIPQPELKKVDREKVS